MAVLLVVSGGFHQVTADMNARHAIQASLLRPATQETVESLPPALREVTLLAASNAPARESLTSQPSASHNADSDFEFTAGMASSPLAARFVPVAPDPMAPFKAGPNEVRRSSRPWLALSLAEHAAAGFDSWATRRAITHGGVSEIDPLMRPFANSNSIYAVMQIGPTGLDFIARKMSHSQNKWMRRLWWVPQSVATVGFLYSGSRDLMLAH